MAVSKAEAKAAFPRAEECVVCLLTFNTFMTIFGAVGTPVWFGIGEAPMTYISCTGESLAAFSRFRQPLGHFRV